MPEAARRTVRTHGVARAEVDASGGRRRSASPPEREPQRSWRASSAVGDASSHSNRHAGYVAATTMAANTVRAVRAVTAAVNPPP